MVGVAAGADARAVARAVVGAVEAQRAAQEGQRRDDARGATRRGLAEQQRVAPVAGRRGARAAGEEELAVDARGLRLLVHELRQQEVRVVGLVPDRPQPDAVAVAPPDGRREGLELLGARLGDVVLLARGRPLRDRAGQRQLDGDAAGRGTGEQRVELVPRPGRVGAGVGGVEGRPALRLRRRRVVLPVDECADAVDPEGVDLVQRAVARGGVEQLARRLEGHALGARSGGRRGKREQHDEQREEGASGEHGRPL